MVRSLGNTALGRLARFFGKLVILSTAIYVIVGALIYPDWWRLFLWHGGIFDKRVWSLGWLVIKEPLGSFWPFGFLIILLIVVGGFWAVFQFGKQGQNFWRNRFDQRLLPKKVWLNSAIACVVVCLALIPRHPQNFDSFWEAIEFERSTKKLISNFGKAFSEPRRGEFEPPTDGVYLYLNEDLLLRQFRALMLPLSVTTATEKSSSGKDIKLEAGPAKTLAVTAGASRGKETELTKQAPVVSAPYAAQQLIDRLAKSEETIKISPGTGLFFGKKARLSNELAELGVKLLPDQVDALTNGERESYRKEVLKAERSKVLLYWGAVAIEREDTNTFVSFKTEGPIAVSGRGLLRNDGLGDHLSLAAHSTKENIRLSAVWLYGVIETRKGGPSSVQLIFTPYAIW